MKFVYPILLLFVFLVGLCPKQLISADVVIELLVSDADNAYWQPLENMHMTIGHVKNVDQEMIEVVIESFNQSHSQELQRAHAHGFVVDAFNTNGFGLGFHILDADKESTKIFEGINRELFEILNRQYGAVMTDKTTPKSINPKGYTPHIQFLERKDGKIPSKGDVMHFKDWRLGARVQ